MKSIKNLIFILTMFIATLGLVQTVKAEDDLYISDWIVDAELLENGDLKISEKLTFEFNTDFNGVYRDIKLRNTSGMTDITVEELTDGKAVIYKAVKDADNGDSKVFTAKESNGNLRIKIYSPSEDEVKTFKISYIVKNVAAKYNDTGELYYKFIGDDNETAIGNLLINIALPSKASDREIKVFAHGPLNGKIYKKDDGLYQLKVNNVPRKTFVEGRIIFPKEFIALSENVVNKNMYSGILAEEEAFQKKLDEERAKKEALKKSLTVINLLSFTACLSLLIYVLIKCRRYITQPANQNESELSPECTPAIASLITNNFLGYNVVVASILDLFRKGYVSINKEQADLDINDNEAFIINKQKEADLSLMPHERHFMNWLFYKLGHGTYINTRDIEKISKHDKSKILYDYNEWKSKVKADAEEKGYYDKSKKGLGSLLIVLSLALFVLGIYTAAIGNAIAILSIGMAAVFTIYGIMLFNRLTDYGYEQKILLNNIKKYISYDYDYTQDLIYGLAMNAHSRQPRDKRYDEAYSMNSWLFWYFIFISSDNNTFKKSMAHSFAPMTESSSSIGGFSGGGGGGAGGGGAGGF
jgi:uncharacterized membrane protein